MIQVVLISSCYEQQEMWLYAYGVIFKYILLKISSWRVFLTCWL